MFKKLIELAIRRPKAIFGATSLLICLALVQFPGIKVDTDPENMLSRDVPVRVFHREMKKEFALYDFIVIGVVNRTDPNGVFNVDTLSNIYNITEEIKGIDGVISREIIAPSTKDNIRQGGIGTVCFNWLMEAPPANEEEALLIRDEARDHPLFHGTGRIPNTP